MIENAARMGSWLQERLRALQAHYPVIGEVRGLGLMVAVEFVHLDGTPNGATAGAIQRHCLEHNLILLTCGPADQTIRFIPPLNVSDAELDEGLAIFADAVRATAELHA